VNASPPTAQMGRTALHVITNNGWGPSDDPFGRTHLPNSSSAVIGLRLQVVQVLLAAGSDPNAACHRCYEVRTHFRCLRACACVMCACVCVRVCACVCVCVCVRAGIVCVERFVSV